MFVMLVLLTEFTPCHLSAVFHTALESHVLLPGIQNSSRMKDLMLLEK